mmetsp:Transcript_15427/g.33996  ORF Transcript_15427/g.33996 Transcript_15427/m.33996 type:complete len:264 (-) Transcript_15427:2482-3273(-)
MSSKKSRISGLTSISPSIKASARPMPGSRSVRQRNLSERTMTVTGVPDPSPNTVSRPSLKTTRRLPLRTRLRRPRERILDQSTPPNLDSGIKAPLASDQELMSTPMAWQAARALLRPSSWKPWPAQAPQKKILPPSRPCSLGSSRCALRAWMSSTGCSRLKRESRASPSMLPLGGFRVTKMSSPSGATPGCRAFTQYVTDAEPAASRAFQALQHLRLLGMSLVSECTQTSFAKYRKDPSAASTRFKDSVPRVERRMMAAAWSA